MGLIKDESGHDIEAEEKKLGDTPASNGHNHGMEKRDVRGLPTGTIIYNLIRVTGEEVGLENFIHHEEVKKAMQKTIGEPPQLAAAKQAYQSMVQGRFVFANELNERFKTLDQARCSELGIEMFVPKGDAPEEG